MERVLQNKVPNVDEPFLEIFVEELLVFLFFGGLVEHLDLRYVHVQVAEPVLLGFSLGLFYIRNCLDTRSIICENHPHGLGVRPRGVFDLILFLGRHLGQIILVVLRL